MTLTAAGNDAADGAPQSEIPPSPESSPQRLSPVWLGIALTVVAWFISRTVVGISWGTTHNPFSLDSRAWSRWDSLNYLNIAQHGSSFAHCRATPFNLYTHQTLCGTASWLPGYPAIMAGTHQLGMTYMLAGVLIAWTATAIALFLVWFGWCRDLPWWRALTVMLFVGVFAGAVYNFAIFPTSLALAFLLGALLAAKRERWAVTALLCVLAGLCYPSAWFAAFGIVVCMLATTTPRTAAALARRALWGVACMCAPLIILIYNEIQFGTPAFFRLERESTGFANFGSFFHLFTLTSINQVKMGHRQAIVLLIQALIALSIVAFAVVMAFRTWSRDRAHTAMWFPAVSALIVALGCMTAASPGTWNRSIVLAAPSVLLLRRAPMVVLCAYVLAVGTITAIISHAFFAGNLI